MALDLIRPLEDLADEKRRRNIAGIYIICGHILPIKKKRMVDEAIMVDTHTHTHTHIKTHAFRGKLRNSKSSS